MVDIRPHAQRQHEGDVPAALVNERTSSNAAATRRANARLPQAVGEGCYEGYTSSLAAASLLDLGLHRATDVVGGYHVEGRHPLSFRHTRESEKLLGVCC